MATGALIALVAIVAAYIHWRIRRPPNLLDDLEPLRRYRNLRDDEGRRHFRRY
jgi:hypothetical protein